MNAMTHKKIPAVFMRGGTSKGVFLRGEDLPYDTAERDRMFSGLLGSPDPYLRQIDGLGGATSSTSKVVAISPSTREDCDVDYLIGQVDIGSTLVDYSSNCGNLSSAVGPYAIRAGLVAPKEGVTEVRIWQVNTSRRIIARVPTRGGLPVEDGDYEIDGVRGSGARIDLEFIDPAGSAFGQLFPTGNTKDTVEVPGLDTVEFSVVDASMVMAFVRAKDIGLEGIELKPAIDSDDNLLARLEAVRDAIAVRLGVSEPGQAVHMSPALPKLAFVTSPREHAVAGGRLVTPSQIDLIARGVSMGRLHHAYEVTGSIATAVAAAIPGTIVHEIAGQSPQNPRLVRIGHASGLIDVRVLRQSNDAAAIISATLGRTARLIMDGTAYIPSQS